MNLKEIANLVYQYYPNIANLFLYLIKRNGFSPILKEVKHKRGKEAINHYRRLEECIETNRELQTTAITLNEIDIIFPLRKKESIHY